MRGGSQASAQELTGISTRWFLYSAAVVSGACALTYELIWFRLLANLCGSTVLAASIMAAVFLAGLSLGSFWFGAKADEARNPLRLFALLEGGVGCCGLFTPLLFSFIEIHLQNNSVLEPVALFGAVAVMLPPTVLMGGTLPVLCRVFGARPHAPVLASFYALNTAGAALGVSLAGFVFLPYAGQQMTLALAVTGNALLCTAALFFARQTVVNASFGRSASRLSHWDLPPWTLMLFVASTGMISLSAQILWMRLFPLYIGNTTYAFTLVLAIFLAGLAAGSAVYRKVQPAADRLWSTICALLVILALGLAVTGIGFDRFSHLFYAAELLSNNNWVWLTVLRLVCASLIILPVTMASGALLPAFYDACSEHPDHEGRRIGFLLAANIGGSIVGSLIVPLFFITSIGVQNSFRLLVLLVVVTGCISAVIGRLKMSRYAVLFSLLAGVILFCPTWDQHLLNSGQYIYAQELSREGGLHEDKLYRRLIEQIDGVESQVAVFEDVASNDLSFVVNGKVDGGTQDMPTQVLLGQLPALLHPAPRKTLVIGLGTGVTLAQTLKYPENHAICLEISPEVIRVADYFSAVNGQVLKNPRATIRRGDARKELLHASETYDLIISEPSNPWQSGNSRLFTREFYRLARERLAVGGLYCQWLPIYDLPPAQLQSALVTFLDSFPEALGFLVNGNDLILIGAKDHVPLIDYGALTARFRAKEVYEALRALRIFSPADLIVDNLIGGKEVLFAMASRGKLNTDDHNSLEYYRFVPKEFAQENINMLRSAIQRAGPSRLRPIVFPEKEGATLRQLLAEAFQESGQLVEAQAIRASGG